jgi:hypothetical protein
MSLVDMGHTVNDPCFDFGFGDGKGGGYFRVRDLLGCASSTEGGEGDQSKFSDNEFGCEVGNGYMSAID